MRVRTSAANSSTAARRPQGEFPHGAAFSRPSRMRRRPSGNPCWHVRHRARSAHPHARSSKRSGRRRAQKKVAPFAHLPPHHFAFAMQTGLAQCIQRERGAASTTRPRLHRRPRSTLTRLKTPSYRITIEPVHEGFVGDYLKECMAAPRARGRHRTSPAARCTSPGASFLEETGGDRFAIDEPAQKPRQRGWPRPTKCRPTGIRKRRLELIRLMGGAV